MAHLTSLVRGIAAQPTWKARLEYTGALLLNNRLKRWQVRRALEFLYGPREFSVGEDEAVVITTVRNGAEYVREFLDYHLGLDGVAHVVLADNDSEDDTVKIARRHPRVTILRQPLSIGTHGAMVRNHLLDRFGRDRWVLNVDIDEFFDFPRAGELCLRDLIRYLRRHRYDAMVTQMLDMFSPYPLSHGPMKGQTLRDFYRCYDLSAIRRDPYENFFGRGNELPDLPICTLWGGIRQAWFGSGDLLTRHSLFFNHRALEKPNPAHGVSGACIADVTGVVRHYRFLPDFSRRVDRAVVEGCHYNKSEKYRLYQAGLAKNPDPVLKLPSSCELQHVDELLKAGFVSASPRYLNWLRPTISRRSGLVAAN